MSILRLWRTVQHLKPQQIANRVTRRVLRPRPSDLVAPQRREVTKRWVEGARRNPTLAGPSEFRFLNEDGAIAMPADWNDAARKKLWLYNLHYFDDLVATDAGARVHWHKGLIDRWIADNPPGHGNGWEPYPISLRIVNWIKWALTCGELDQRKLSSLAEQARWLAQAIEYHLLGNHIWANAKALIFAGLFFQGPEADKWLQTGMRILAQERAEQILADGGHFERSPMYHSILCEDILDLVNLSATLAGHEILNQRKLKHVATAMLQWLRVMRHPDGRISFFNDAAFEIAAEPDSLFAYAARLSVDSGNDPKTGISQLQASGYYRLQNETALALFDAAPIGPDYLPGHAHADTLSLELSCFGERLFVNAGTSTYEIGTDRSWERSTPAHNTMAIDGLDSSEVWAGFRVGRRARVFDLSVEDHGPTALSVAASHDGYRAQPGRPVHRRQLRLEPSRFCVEDKILGQFQNAEVMFHLVPNAGVTISDTKDNGAILTPNGRSIRWHTSGRAQIRDETWRPEFGKRIPNQCIAIQLTGPQLSTAFSWS